VRWQLLPREGIAAAQLREAPAVAHLTMKANPNLPAGFAPSLAGHWNLISDSVPEFIPPEHTREA
jgi:hypothetical protein